MLFLRIFKHLLPRSRAWIITIEKTLRKFFEALSISLGDQSKEYYDLIYFDIFPETTRELELWEQQWALPESGLTEEERRSRLDATWKAVGGQSPRYIQDTLQAAGFDVYVHEWWIPGTEPPLDTQQCATPRNPYEFLQPIGVECGEALSECGEEGAECGNIFNLGAIGEVLVNVILQNSLVNGTWQIVGDVEYGIPNDPNKWPYILFIGGENYGDFAGVPIERENEFKSLCLKICPEEQWIGLIVKFDPQLLIEFEPEQGW